MEMRSGQEQVMLLFQYLAGPILLKELPISGDLFQQMVVCRCEHGGEVLSPCPCASITLFPYGSNTLHSLHECPPPCCKTCM